LKYSEETNHATSWLHVYVAFIGGCLICIHIGKVPASLPFLDEEMRLGLLWSSTIVSAFSLVIGAFGIFMGILADRSGHKLAAIGGLFICAFASLAGALSDGLPLLLVSRVFEGLGYVFAVVALPSLIAISTTDRDKPVAMGIWAAFLPAGMAFMLLLSPVLLAWIGWRGLWVFAGVLTLAWAVVLVRVFRDTASPVRETLPVREAGRLLVRTGPLFLFGCFIAYSSQFLAVTSFLPVMLIETYGVSVGQAASLGALVVAGNVTGNIASGWMLRHGVSRATLLAVGAAGSGACTLILFSDIFPFEARIAGAFAFTAIGGVIPGTLYASAPHFVARPGQMAGIVGLLMQGAGMGQVLGPLLLTAVVDGFGGWSYAALYTVAMTIVGVLFAVLLSRVKPNR
jgi:MFS family permease